MIPHYDVFVSHASEDKLRFVDSFVAALEERGQIAKEVLGER